MESKKIIEELNKKELSLLSTIRSMKGTMEEIEAKLKELNVFEQYNEIFQEYSQLIENKVNSLESLKRALFILWYSIAEPSCYSGISSLDKKSERKVVSKLNELIKNNQLDTELKWMLLYYGSISKWYFENFKEQNELLEFIRLSESFELPLIQKSEMYNRGQMGEYWKSLIQ